VHCRYRSWRHDEFRKLQISKIHKVLILIMIITLPVLLSEKATAQQDDTSTAVLSERLLNAVDKRDLTTVKALLSSDSGRSLARLPIGLTAAGRAIENSHYNIAHYILAVRFQQMRFKTKNIPEAKKTENLTVKGGFISSESQSPAQTRQNSLPDISHLKTGDPPKKKLVSMENERQPSKRLPNNRRSKRQLSNQANPFDPLNIPSIGLPAVK